MKPTDLSPVDYICEEERESDNPTIFKLKPLSGLQMVNLGVIAAEKGQGAAVKHVLSKHLIGWENFGEAPFTNDMDSNISLLSKDIIQELMDALDELSNLSEEETKN